MPAWLRDSRALPEPPTGSAPENLAPDPHDTTKFLSEDDLPDWLRRLAALPVDAEMSREPPEAVPFPSTSTLAEAEAAFLAEAPRRTLPRQEVGSPPDQAPTEDRIPAVLTPVTSNVAQPIEPPVQPSEPVAGMRDADAQEVVVRDAEVPTPEPPQWRRLLLALVLAIVVVALVYLVTSGGR